jgi:hypothetical protein
MKKAILVVVIVSLLVLAPLFGVVRANPNPGPAPPSINISWTPNFVTNTINLKLNILVCYDTNNCKREAWYSLDGASNISIPLVFKEMENPGSYMPPQTSVVTGQIDIPMWSQGPHILTVYTKYSYGNFFLPGSKTLYIGQPAPTSTAPILNIISPKNQALYINQVPITYNINLKLEWSYYALDTVGEPEGSDWKPFTGNITLTGLSEGSHKIVISVKAETAYVPAFTEKTVTFTVGSNNNTDPSSSPTMPNLGPTSSPTAPEFPALIVLPLIMATLSIALIIRSKSRKFD